MTEDTIIEEPPVTAVAEYSPIAAERAEFERVRAQSKAGQSGPWVTHYEEMAKKTAIRRLFKYLPVSIEFQRAIGLDEQAEAGLPQESPFTIDAETGEVFGADEQNTPQIDATPSAPISI